jgi:signal transduction histidine kinase
MSTHPPVSILVIEDDLSVRQTLVDILELNGYRASATDNGLDGLALARRDLPTLIITDIAMPRMTGFELLTALRADEKLRAIPVIVISAKIDREATRHGMELGADDFITKPFTEDEVLHSIRARLEKRELLDELDAFAHTVAHDLKNPLATLYGRLGLLEMTIGKTTPEADLKNVAEALTAATRLSTIIDDLLMLAGVRQQHIQPTVLDTSALVTEALDRLEALLLKTGARINRPPSWPAAIGFAPWVIHVWSNYISNAAKYAGPAAVIDLGATPSADGRRVRFWVQDRGPGLDAAAQAALFVPFTRISAIRVKGHGLGLSIVRRIVEKLGGQVGVDSNPGQGARFWFELPAATPSPPSHSP